MTPHSSLQVHTQFQKLSIQIWSQSMLPRFQRDFCSYFFYGWGCWIMKKMKSQETSDQKVSRIRPLLREATVSLADCVLCTRESYQLRPIEPNDVAIKDWFHTCIHWRYTSSMPQILDVQTFRSRFFLRRVLLPSQARAHGLPRCERNTWALFQDGHTVTLKKGLKTFWRRSLNCFLGTSHLSQSENPAIGSGLGFDAFDLQDSGTQKISHHLNHFRHLHHAIVRMACVDGNANEAHVSIACERLKGKKIANVWTCCIGDLAA